MSEDLKTAAEETVGIEFVEAKDVLAKALDLATLIAPTVEAWVQREGKTVKPMSGILGYITATRLMARLADTANAELLTHEPKLSLWIDDLARALQKKLNETPAPVTATQAKAGA